MRRKLEDRADQAIADEMGVSRPTVINRKRELHEIIRRATDGLPQQIQAAVVERLSYRFVSDEHEGTE